VTTPAHLIRDAARLIPVPEAEFLLTALLHRPRHRLYLDRGPVPARKAARFQSLVSRAAAGAPAQYLVRSAPFLDLDLYVDPRVVIPRPETEELVLRAARRARAPRLVLDYGTGSGCIAIALARMFPRARVLAVDRSLPALQVCRRNTKRYRLSHRIALVRADTLGAPRLRRLAGRADLLISNPPYVPAERIPKLPVRVRDHEPMVGLDGGRKGTKILAMLLDLGPGFLSPRGLLALEIDLTHARFVRARLPQAGIERDLNGKVRYAFSTRAA